MFWCDFSSIRHELKNGFKQEDKQMIKSISVENDERFASIFTYNSERNYGGNRYNTAFGLFFYLRGQTGDGPKLIFKI